jgi:hypothetical protein
MDLANRFRQLVLKRRRSRVTARRALQVVVNWLEEVKQRGPTR